MRIDSRLPVNSSENSDRIRQKPVARETAMQDGSSSQVSSEAARLRSFESTANNVADIRDAKVRSLKAALEAGKYQVTDSDLADAILRDRLRN